jgi:hypothetical protein
MTPAPLRQSQKADTPKFQPRASDLPAGNTFTRMLAARVLASAERRTANEIAARMWPNDRVTAEIIERAASAPALTAVAGWAAELAQRKIVDTLKALHPYSAAAALFAQGTSLAFDGAGSISVPGFVTTTITKGFVADGQPIPVQQPALVIPADLKPTKLAGIAVLSHEMLASSNAETLIADVVLRMLGNMLDAALVDNNAAAADRPAGLRNGVSTQTASTAADTWGAFTADVRTLANAVGPVSSNAPIAFVGSPGRAIAVNVMLSGQTLPVFGTGALTNEFLCVATAALVSVLGDVEVESGTAASLHMDTVPIADIGSAGRHMSMWQTDSVAIKTRWPVAWIVRDPRGVSWMTPTAW